MQLLVLISIYSRDKHIFSIWSSTLSGFPMDNGNNFMDDIMKWIFAIENVSLTFYEAPGFAMDSGNNKHG